jgi:uncharacterized protein YeaO (DUF488 family)
MSGARCKPDIKLKRLYEAASRADGTCILVGHLWSRSSRKEGTVIEHWFKDLTPSTALGPTTVSSAGRSFPNDIG